MITTTPVAAAYADAVVAKSLQGARVALVTEHAQAIYLVHAEALRAGMVEPVIVVAVRDNHTGGQIVAVLGRDPAIYARTEQLLLLELVQSTPEFYARISAALANQRPPLDEVRIAIFSHGGAEVCRWRLDVSARPVTSPAPVN